MRVDHLRLLVCPQTGQPLKMGPSCVVEDGRIKEGILVEQSSGNEYPIVNYIPRFVPQDNYARSFGVEWTIHGRTQYDAYSGFSISGARFKQETKWGEDLRGEIMLEVGSGSGRFTTHALETEATVVSFDYSCAVEANYQSNGYHENLLLVQADACEMPFRGDFFDRAFCFGVLQHTPDPKKTFFSIVEHLKLGGKIASDVYLKGFTNMFLSPKYWVRPFTRGRGPEKLYPATRRYVDFMWPLAKIIRRIPKIGKSINWGLLVADYSRLLPKADDSTLREWAYLDTFDMLAPRYDKPQTLKTFRRWHREARLVDIDVHRGLNGIEGRGTKARREDQ